MYTTRDIIRFAEKLKTVICVLSTTGRKRSDEVAAEVRTSGTGEVRKQRRRSRRRERERERVKKNVG